MMATTRKVRQLLATSFLVASVILSSSAAQAATKSEGDARIKTLIYNDNEVFRIVMRNGFQTDVELSNDESIDTLSIGDSIGWQITPAAHRIFIKPLQRNGITNLSVITTKRTYQFELVATNPTNNAPDHAYVVKFYYPDAESTAAAMDRTRGFTRPVSPTAIPELPIEAPAPAKPIAPPVMPGDVAAPTPAPISAATPTPPPTPQLIVNATTTKPPEPVTPPTPPVMPGDMKAPVTPLKLGSEGYNFNYTLSGPEESAPIKIYDDGKSTFFQFKGQPSPALNFARVMPDGSEIAVPTRPDADGRVIVDQVADKFTIRDGSTLICVFNEQQNAAASPATQARP